MPRVIDYELSAGSSPKTLADQEQELHAWGVSGPNDDDSNDLDAVKFAFDAVERGNWVASRIILQYAYFNRHFLDDDRIRDSIELERLDERHDQLMVKIEALRTVRNVLQLISKISDPRQYLEAKEALIEILSAEKHDEIDRILKNCEIVCGGLSTVREERRRILNHPDLEQSTECQQLLRSIAQDHGSKRAADLQQAIVATQRRHVALGMSIDCLKESLERNDEAAVERALEDWVDAIKRGIINYLLRGHDESESVCFHQPMYSPIPTRSPEQHNQRRKGIFEQALAEVLPEGYPHGHRQSMDALSTEIDRLEADHEKVFQKKQHLADSCERWKDLIYQQREDDFSFLIRSHPEFMPRSLPKRFKNVGQFAYMLARQNLRVEIRHPETGDTLLHAAVRGIQFTRPQFNQVNSGLFVRGSRWNREEILEQANEKIRRQRDDPGRQVLDLLLEWFRRTPHLFLVRNNQGKTPMDLALERADTWMVSFLLADYAGYCRFPIRVVPHDADVLREGINVIIPEKGFEQTPPVTLRYAVVRGKDVQEKVITLTQGTSLFDCYLKLLKGVIAYPAEQLAEMSDVSSQFSATEYALLIETLTSGERQTLESALVNRQDAPGNSLLHKAIRDQNYDLAMLLIFHYEADLFLPNARDVTPWDMVKHQENVYKSQSDARIHVFVNSLLQHAYDYSGCCYKITNLRPDDIDVGEVKQGRAIIFEWDDEGWFVYAYSSAAEGYLRGKIGNGEHALFLTRLAKREKIGPSKQMTAIGDADTRNSLTEIARSVGGDIYSQNGSDGGYKGAYPHRRNMSCFQADLRALFEKTNSEAKKKVPWFNPGFFAKRPFWGKSSKGTAAAFLRNVIQTWGRAHLEKHDRALYGVAEDVVVQCERESGVDEGFKRRIAESLRRANIMPGYAYGIYEEVLRQAHEEATAEILEKLARQGICMTGTSSAAMQAAHEPSCDSPVSGRMLPGAASMFLPLPDSPPGAVRTEMDTLRGGDSSAARALFT